MEAIWERGVWLVNSSRKRLAAFMGPMVWEEEGPIPILKRSRTEMFMEGRFFWMRVNLAQNGRKDRRFFTRRFFWDEFFTRGFFAREKGVSFLWDLGDPLGEEFEMLELIA